jgi:aminoglycoside phosphotransferase (APT) family kinase protein
MNQRTANHKTLLHAMGIAFDQLILPGRQFQVIEKFGDALTQLHGIDPMEFADEMQKLAALSFS